MKISIQRTLDAIEHQGVLFDCTLSFTVQVRTGIPGYRFDSEIVDRRVDDFQLEDPHGMHFSPRSDRAVCAWARTRILHAIDELEIAREAAERPPLIDLDAIYHEAVERYQVLVEQPFSDDFAIPLARTG